MSASYTYEPSNITSTGKDRMRFELGDTMVESGSDTAYLSDEEIAAMLSVYPSWKRAKLALVESVVRRFSYEVDTHVGPLRYSLSQRYPAWKAMYDEMKKEVGAACSVPSDPIISQHKPPYFFEGMHDNKEAIAARRRGGKCTLDQEC